MKNNNALIPFDTLDNSQMKQIKGGKWIKVRKPDGTIELVWV